MLPRLFAALSVVMVILPSSSAIRCLAQESDEAPAGLVDFVRDVYPIFVSRCLECHGPEDAKNDWRVDDQDSVVSYLEPGDLESSSLWTDYLITDDEDMHMPPLDKPQLTGSQLATVKLWIEEGALWSDVVAQPDEDEKEVEIDMSSVPFAKRAFEFQGLFHPASVHFPIALLSISTFFLLLSFFNRETFEPAAFHCLWIGALFSVVASVMGWGYAIHEGYGSGFSFDFENSGIDRHRWLGIGITIFALVLIPMARSVRSRGDSGMRFLWFIGSVIVTLGISTTGYQGGELTYGEDHYQKEFERLFPESAEPATGDTSDDDLAANEDTPSGESGDADDTTATQTIDEPASARDSDARDSDAENSGGEDTSEDGTGEEASNESKAEEKSEPNPNET